MIHYINVKSSKRTEFINISHNVQDFLQKNGVYDGICYIHIPHTTAAITINEGTDPSVCHDIVSSLNKLIPKDAGYRHMERNSDAHIKSSLIGTSVVVLVEKSRLVLGTWQAIFFCEFDGPRQRKIALKVLNT